MFYGGKRPHVKGVADRLSLPDSAGSVDAYANMSPRLRRFFDTGAYLLPKEQWKRPERRPFVGFSKKEYGKVIKRLFGSGAVELTTEEPEFTNGIFACGKSEAEDRLIIDAYLFNLRCAPIDDPHLPNPDCLTNMVIAAGQTLEAGKTDAANMYWKLRLTGGLRTVRKYLALPPVPGAHFGVDAPKVWPRLVVIPMGWTHSVSIAQDDHERIGMGGLLEAVASAPHAAGVQPMAADAPSQVDAVQTATSPAGGKAGGTAGGGADGAAGAAGADGTDDDATATDDGAGGGAGGEGDGDDGDVADDHAGGELVGEDAGGGGDGRDAAAGTSRTVFDRGRPVAPPNRTAASDLSTEDLRRMLRPLVATVQGGGPFDLTVDQFLSLRMGYIDDECQLALREAQVRWGIVTVVQALTAAGLPSKPSKTQLPDRDRQLTILLGIAVHRKGYVLPSPDALVTLEHDTRALLRYRAVAPKDVASLVGSWIWAMLLYRPTLAIFQDVFDFIDGASTTRRPWKQSVRDELWAAIAVMPSLVVHLDQQYAKICVASDASMEAAGAVSAPIDRATAVKMHAVSKSKGWNQRVDLPEEELDSTGDPRFDDELREYVTRTTEDDGWRCCIRHKWRWRDHITMQEGRAALLLLEWVARQPRLHGTRLPILIDNMAVCGAFCKGRSSSRRLNRICRKYAALCAFTATRPLVVWVPTDFQPADRPSRM